jgi:RNA polymerase sigma-70 factor (ECF subfamily)
MTEMNEPRSFDEIYRELREQILALGLRMTGRREDAEDVLQETFLLVHRHLPSFRGESKVSTWVYRIATRVALATRNRRPVGRPAPLDPEVVGDDPASVPADPLQSKEEVQRIHLALQSLSPVHQAVLSLLAIDELSPSQVAEILGIPEGTVWSRASQARKLLRQKLSGAGSDEGAE